LLARKVAGLSSELSFEVYDLLRGGAKAAEYGVDKVATVCTAGDRG
jgi:hypothetical protein